MLYLDTAALVKLIRHEPETDELIDWLDDRTTVPWLTSVIAEVELSRALLRAAPTTLAAVPALLARLNRCELDEVVRATAASLPGEHLRTLDAIHLATAAVVAGTELDGFVTYDPRLAAHAREQGLPVEAPGAG
ncbi:type II toxin-antitoxin system VapC family toxin [Actinomycetospora endophytica]|uniref:Ribonuclease VapC n=1 Tax=Actinomycetospora endophytica TaxID=2291215 RepID=A0ABS8PAI4_9PSEU|nr:type II toxin-antitoxin system VapC family toxin [Actinomycetospora endophytica]MCD2194004.1 type II toxin-antitoxin system VapC family toxin [Actinomycetospora endophytica]